eukprot:Skav214055  [mRNA]  locus=scaffold2017:452209:459126:- [translate_table: standard]
MADGRSLSLTGDHLLRLRGTGSEWHWQRAKDARVGDYLEDAEDGAAGRGDSGQEVELVKVTCLTWQGAYAPLTLCGELLVDATNLKGLHQGETWHAALKGHGQLDMFSEQEVNKKLMLERFQDSISGQNPKTEVSYLTSVAAPHVSIPITRSHFDGMFTCKLVAFGGIWWHLVAFGGIWNHPTAQTRKNILDSTSLAPVSADRRLLPLS